MPRVLMAGVVGGMMLVIWSAVFTAFGPERTSARQDSALASVLHERLGDLREYIPLGPAEANAASVTRANMSRVETRPVASASLDPMAVAQGMGVACIAATFAALLMSSAGGRQKAFADRVVVAVLLGVFASGAMLVAGGRWAEFSFAAAAPLVGEVVVGWLFAGMVIAVVLRPQPRRARA